MADTLQLIRERHSDRVAFDPERPVPREDLRRVLEAARWAPTAHNMQNYEIIVVEDKALLETIRSIRHPASETFIRENYAQLSFSEEELRKKKVGLLGTMFPPAWRVPGAQPDVAPVSPATRQMLPSPALLFVLYDPSRRAPASEGDFLGIMSLGCVMENMWLMAQALGLGFHIVSSLASGAAEVEVKDVLGIPEQLRIAFACRLGYPISEPEHYLRVRREVEDFTYHDRYGQHGLAENSG